MLLDENLPTSTLYFKFSNPQEKLGSNLTFLILALHHCKLFSISFSKIKIEGLYSTPFFSFKKVLQRKKLRFLLPFTRLSFDQNVQKVSLSYFVVCFIFSDFWSVIKMHNLFMFSLFISSVYHKNLVSPGEYLALIFIIAHLRHL